MIKRVLFSRVGWMKYYDGPKPDDPKPIGGGSFNKKNEGAEMYNFSKIGGYYYGFIQHAANTTKIALRRVQPEWQESSLPDVLVVFASVDPDERRRQRVVGWYRNATLYQMPQRWDARKSRSKKPYYAVTKIKSAVLLRVRPYERKWFVPAGTGGIGQANVCYLYDIDGTRKKLPWANRIIKRIEKWQRRS